MSVQDKLGASQVIRNRGTRAMKRMKDSHTVEREEKECWVKDQEMVALFISPQTGRNDPL